MNKAWIAVTSEPYLPVAKVMIRSLLEVTSFPIIVYGVGFSPEIESTESRVIHESNNIGFLRLEAVIDASLDVCIHVDSDMLFGKTVDYLFNEEKSNIPLMPIHPIYDYADLDYESRHGVTRCFRVMNRQFVQTMPYVQSCLHVVHKESLAVFKKAMEVKARVETLTKSLTEESALNAILWTMGCKRNLGRIVRSHARFDEDMKSKTLHPMWHGERDGKKAAARLDMIRNFKAGCK